MLTLTFEEVYIKLSPFILLFRILVLLPTISLSRTYIHTKEAEAEKEHKKKKTFLYCVLL